MIFHVKHFAVGSCPDPDTHSASDLLYKRMFCVSEFALPRHPFFEIVSSLEDAKEADINRAGVCRQMEDPEDRQTIQGSGVMASSAVQRKRAPSGFAWHDDYALGLQTMDETHRELVACVHALLTTEDGNLENALEAFAGHARQHFDDEDTAMRETAYGSTGCHIDEHAAVLRSLDEVRTILANGRTDVVRGTRVRSSPDGHLLRAVNTSWTRSASAWSVSST